MNGTDIILLCGCAGYMIITFLIDLKLLFYYEHPDDGTLNKEILAKFVIILGLQLAWLMTILLPLDAYNQNPPDGEQNAGLNMILAWYIVWTFVAIFVIIPLPFAVFYYEADDDIRISKKSPSAKALFYTFMLLIIVGTSVGLLYIFLREATLTIDRRSCALWNLPNDGAKSAMLGDTIQDINSICRKIENDSFVGSVKKEIIIDFISYLISVMAFIGWFLFSTFGGIGIAALPIDFIIAFVDRPTPIDLQTYGEKKRFLGKKALALKLIGEELEKEEIKSRNVSGGRWEKRKKNQNIKSDINKYRQAVFFLEREYNHLNIALKERGENPFFAYLKLFLGMICLILSISWLTHIVIYIIVPQMGQMVVNANNYSYLMFLDLMLIRIGETPIAIVSIFIYAIYVSFLLLCVIKGCFKFGMRFFFCFAIHPMKKEDTHLNSILFNVALILTSSTAVVQFSQQAFRGYASLTAATWIFEVQLYSIKFLGVFFRYFIFIYIFLGFALLTLIYLLLKPRDRTTLENTKFSCLPDKLQLKAMEIQQTLIVKDGYKSGGPNDMTSSKETDVGVELHTPHAKLLGKST